MIKFIFLDGVIFLVLAFCVAGAVILFAKSIFERKGGKHANKRKTNS